VRSYGDGSFHSKLIKVVSPAHLDEKKVFSHSISPTFIVEVLMCPHLFVLVQVVIKPQLNTFECLSNLGTAIEAAKTMGLSIVNIGAQDIIDAKVWSTVVVVTHLDQSC
jgi:hypothetical protein